MDRRSWLWRRKSSDKSSGETESLGSGSGSGSMSSPSERFSDEQQVYPIQNTQSPEVNSNHAEDTHNSVKILSEKLSAAFAAIHEKEELVKQHAKVAEEAVNGWEMAENEMNALKQQLDAATNKNLILEDKIVHLDGAFKECLRQLRQVREEQDQIIKEAKDKKSDNTEFISSDLQCNLADISAQLEIANAKAEAAISIESDLRLKLESYEKENASFQLELCSQSEVLELRTLERDLSTKRAETASKHHLESRKMVAKLEAECRQLKAMARKGTSFNDRKSPNDFEIEEISSKTHMTSPSNIGFMDDFLEMEKLVAQPIRDNRSSIDKCNENGDDSTLLKTELEVMAQRIGELEERIEMVEEEKGELRLTLTQCQDKLQISESGFKQLQTQFIECQNQLKLSQAQLKDANKKIGNLQAELDLAGELRQAIDLELDDANGRREDAETQLKTLENESKNLQSKVIILEDKLSRMENDTEAWQNRLDSTKESKKEVEQKLKGIMAKKESVESELKAVKTEVKSLLAKIGSLENDSEKERRLSVEFDAKCRKLESELSRTKHEADMWQSRFTSVNDLKEGMTRELQMVKSKKEEVKKELENVQREAKSLLSRVSSLENEMDKERTLSMEFAAKCRKLEDELSRIKSEGGIQFAPLSKEMLNKEQEKELAVAASKLAECQKTIASLGNQLKSLTSLEDLFSDSDNQLDISDKESQLLKTDMEPASLCSSNILTVQSDSLSFVTGTQNSFSVSLEDDQEFAKDAKEKEGLSSLVVEKNPKNGLGKFFSRSRSSVRTQNLR